MINVFENAPDIDKIVSTQNVPTLKWINITGSTKTGKTNFLMKLAETERVAIIDLEQGTKAYKGNFIRAETFQEFRQKLTWLTNNIDKIKPTIIALDPISRLAELIETYYLQKNGLDNLADVPFGKGWSDTRDLLLSVIRHCFTLAPLLITVTHVNIKILGESRHNITHMDMDLPGKTKKYVQKEADAHAVFSRAVNDDGENYLKISFDSSEPDTISFAGSRFKEFYGNISEDEFAKLIIEKSKGGSNGN